MLDLMMNYSVLYYSCNHLDIFSDFTTPSNTRSIILFYAVLLFNAILCYYVHYSLSTVYNILPHYAFYYCLKHQSAPRLV